MTNDWNYTKFYFILSSFSAGMTYLPTLGSVGKDLVMVAKTRISVARQGVSLTCILEGKTSKLSLLLHEAMG